MKTSIVGRYTRAITLAAWDQTARRGFTMTAVPNTRRGIETSDTAELLVSVEEQNGEVASPRRYFAVEGCVVPGSAVGKAATWSADGRTGQICDEIHGCKELVGCGAGKDPTRELHDGGGLLHANLLAHGASWTQFFEGGGMQVRAISDCHFAVQLNHFIPGLLSYLAPVF